METRPEDTRAALVDIAREVRRKNLSFVAGSLAYNAFASLVPLLLLLFLVAGSLGGEAVAIRATELTQGYLTPSGQDLVADALDGTEARTGLSAIGGVALLWGTLKVFRGLNTAFGVVYETVGERSLVGQVESAVTALVAIGLAVATVSAAGAAFAVVRLPLLHLLNPLFLLLGLTVAFLPLYYVLPDVDVTLREALPGAFVAAGGWALLEVGFQIYAANVGQYEAYGVLGAVLLLTTWLYFSGFVLLVGAATNYVLAGRAGTAAAAPAPTESVGADVAPDGSRDGRERVSTESTVSTATAAPTATTTAPPTATPAPGREAGAGPRPDPDPGSDPGTDSDLDPDSHSGPDPDSGSDLGAGSDPGFPVRRLGRRVGVSIVGLCALLVGVAVGRLSK